MSDIAASMPPPPPGTLPEPAPVEPRDPRFRRRVVAIVLIGTAVVVAGAIGTALGRGAPGRGRDVTSEQIVAVLAQAGQRIVFDGEPKIVRLGDDCLVRNPRVLARLVPGGVDVEQVRRAERSSLASRIGAATDPVVFDCTLGTDDEALGVVVFPTPAGPYDEYLERSLAAGGTVTVGAVQSVSDGDVLPYCTARPALSTCGADWSDGDLVVGVYGTMLDEEQATQWLLAVLPDALTDLRDLDLASIDTDAGEPAEL